MYWAATEHAWLLLLLPPAVLLWRRAARVRARDLARLAGGDAPRPAPDWPVLLARTAAFLLLVAALCRPQWGYVDAPLESHGLDILVALDVSRSMLADDTPPSRLARAKSALSGMLARLGGDRVGLLAFAGGGWLVCPLTTDYATYAELLRETSPDMLPAGGTRIADALAEARRVFRARPGSGRVVILVSDGEDHAGGALDTARALAADGVTLHVAGVGSAAGGLIPLPGGDLHRSRDGDIVRSRADVDALAALAAAGGGRLLDLSGQPDALEQLYTDTLAEVEKRTLRSQRRLPAERFQIPLALAVLLLLAEPWLRPRSAA